MTIHPAPGRLLAALVLTLASSLGAFAAERVDTRPAPALVLPDRAGATVSLASLRGRVVLVDIWATWCPPCRTSLPAYAALLREYRGRGFEVLAVNVDETRAAVDTYLQGRDLDLRVLLDPKGQTPTSFKAKAMPTAFLIDRRGNIRFSHEGFTEKALEQYRRHIEQLLAEPAE